MEIQHVAALEVLMLKMHMLVFLIAGHLLEPVHVELTDERTNLIVSEKVWQHYILQFQAVLDDDLVVVGVPADDILVFLFLNWTGCTSRISYTFITNSGIASRPDIISIGL